MFPDAPATLREDRPPSSAVVLHVLWDGGARRYPLPAEITLVVGRLESCDVVVPHPSVSRRHCRLLVSREGVRVEDLGSANGTRIGGARLAAGGTVALPAGVAVAVGGALLVVEPAVASPMRAVEQEGDLLVLPGSAFAATIADANRFAAGPISVLVRGETGAGKEAIAEQLHAHSPRAARPLVRVNCAALPGSLLESELFGHERGAFTGADHGRPGLLEAADGGTLFLDEIGDMPLDLQAKILRVLERGEILRVGGRTPRRVDVRFVAATNQPLDEAMARGTFRRDLYFRLAGAVLTVPPLRQRRDEIVPLALRLHARFAARMQRALPPLGPGALALLEAHDWPGNVRELKNVVERAALVASGPVIEPADLRVAPVTPPPLVTPAEVAGDLRAERERAEARRIEEALSATDGDQGRAAELLGISRRTLLRRLDAYALPRPRKR